MGVSLMSISVGKINEYLVIEALPEGMTTVGTPPFVYKKGSFTLEAALLLPMLACFFACILFFFPIMQIQLSVQSALDQTGRNLAILAVREKTEEDAESLGYLVLAQSAVYLELQQDELIKKYVTGGVMGISLLASEFEEDYIVLNANYRVKIPLTILGKQSFSMSQKACFRKWTGWHVVDVQKQKDMLVYLTIYGEVYHMRKSCPYLTLSICKAEKIYVPILRNENGAKYKECLVCRYEKENTSFVYVTKYGEKYHYSIECKGLKRTIYQKSLSEVEGMEACAKCWK